ncbi:hypothetical protein GCM10022405_27330 [Gibbsiella dentisursi]|uniref:Transposase IS116/IS110/IS902 C-terminal domain-containing protein n=1 Tax=Gibbsiella dentisursi TaxID=796890 RepID=A0ABP7LEN7_9GAMM
MRLDGSIAYNKKISRSKLLDIIRQFEPGTLIAMEACSTSHFWGRTFRTMGYNVRLIPAQHVKAFVRSQKNDANDALAICETACRPGIHFVQALNERVTGLDKEIAALSSQQTAYRHLLTIPGVGPLIAAAFISEVDAGQFSSGRELSAWCGLVPRAAQFGRQATIILRDKKWQS